MIMLKEKIQEITKIAKSLLLISHSEDDLLMEMHVTNAIAFMNNTYNGKIDESLFEKFKSILLMHVIALYNEELTQEQITFITRFYRGFCNYKL